MMLDAQVIADAADDEIDGVLKGLRPSIKGGHGGQHHGAGLSTSGQIAQLNQMQRRLARHQHERTTFLQMNVGGAMNKVLRQTVSDGRGRAHAARTNDHSRRQKGAAGDSRPEVHEVMIMHLSRIEVGLFSEQVGENKAIEANSAIQFLFNDLHGGGAEKEMNGSSRAQQHFQQAHAIGAPLAPVRASTRLFAAIDALTLEKEPAHRHEGTEDHKSVLKAVTECGGTFVTCRV